MDTTKNIECNNKNMYQSHYNHEHVIIGIMNTKDNINNKEKGNSNGKKERFSNEEDKAIETKRHKSLKDQVRDIDKKINDNVYTLPIESGVNKYISKYITKTDNDFEMVD